MGAEKSNKAQPQYQQITTNQQKKKKKKIYNDHGLGREEVSAIEFQLIRIRIIETWDQLWKRENKNQKKLTLLA